MRRAYHSSRGAVQSEVCLSVIEEPHRGVLSPQGLSGHEKIYIFCWTCLFSFPGVCVCVFRIYIQDVSRLVDITAGGDFLGLYDKRSSYKHASDCGRLWSYGHFLIPVHALV